MQSQYPESACDQGELEEERNHFWHKQDLFGIQQANFILPAQPAQVKTAVD